MIATFAGYQTLSGAPGGWTPTFAPGSNSGTWYRFATASEPASYTWTASKDIFHNVAISGVITAFSGVDPSTPLQDRAQAAGSGASAPLPSAVATRPGSLRVSTVTSAAGVTSSFPGMTTACDRTAGGTAAALAFESVGLGPVPPRTAARSGSGAYVAQTLVLNPGVACAAGNFSLAAPAAISFPPTTLTGSDIQRSASTTLRVDDQRALASGWNIAATSTRLTNGSAALPDDAVKITGARAVAASGNCVPPINASLYPVQLPAGLAAPTAAKMFSTLSGTGTGPVDVELDMVLDIPANARVGNYAATWTFTLQSGP